MLYLRIMKASIKKSNTLKTFVSVLIFSLALIFSSCTKTLGYGITLWGNDEAGVTDGEILKVYIRSNISKVYVVSRIDDKKKFEVPLWQLSDPESKRKAFKALEKYKEYTHTYATVASDGLPIRAKAINTSKQVYRLRQGEIIRCLYEGSGTAPTNGHGNLNGKWIRVLTENGTQGWCFSYNLRLFQKNPGEEFVSENNLKENSESSSDEKLLNALSKAWVPEYYGEMLKKGRVDLDQIKENYGFKNVNIYSGEGEDAVIEKKYISIQLPALNYTYSYETVEKNFAGEYEFFAKKGDAVSGLKINPRGESRLVVQYTDQNGKQKAENFVTVNKTYQEIVEEENLRRLNEYEQIYVAGPVFSSSNYGKLTLNEDGSFTWSGYNLLVPSIIAKNAKGNGTVNSKLFIDSSLKVSYDGVLTFNFAGMSQSVNFLYKIVDNGLRLEDTATATIRDNVVKSRSASPVILFFNAEKSE